MALAVYEVKDEKQWGTFVSSLPRGHLLQSYTWGELHQYVGNPVFRLGAYQDERLVGAMLVSVSPLPVPLLRRRYTWLYCSRGPISQDDNPVILNALFTKAHDIAASSHAVVLKLEPNILEEDARTWQSFYSRSGFRGNQLAIHGRRSWVLDLCPDEKSLLAGCSSTWRRYIRQGERQGLEIRLAESEEDFESYYRLLVITSQRDGFFLHAKDYHREIYQRFSQQGNAALFLAFYQGRAVAARMVLCFGDTCTYMFGGTEIEDRSIPKTHAIMFRCILWAKEKGCRFFDFRVIPDTFDEKEEMYGVYFYKKGFGGYSRLHMQTQDYVYRPLIYMLWNALAHMHRAKRRRRHIKKQTLQ